MCGVKKVLLLKRVLSMTGVPQSNKWLRMGFHPTRQLKQPIHGGWCILLFVVNSGKAREIANL